LGLGLLFYVSISVSPFDGFFIPSPLSVGSDDINVSDRSRGFPCLLLYLLHITTVTDLRQYLVLLIFGSPLWSLVLSSILQLISLFLGLVDGSLGVLSWGVDSEQAKGGWASVDD